MAEGKQGLIVVLGMHRSGTSAITRGLQVMGVDLGEKLMPAMEDINAKGFWEDLDLNKLNNELLSVLGSDWHHLAPVEPGHVEALRKNGYFVRAVELIFRKLDKRALLGFKDPRVAKLLPFWQEVFSQFDTRYVLVVRHPLSVVKSLARRDGFDAEKSYLLWLGHMIEIFSVSSGSACVLVDYDKLMHSPEFEITRIANRFDLEINVAEFEAYRSHFLDKTLQHTIYDLNDLSLDDACPPLVREIYATLLDVASDKIALDDPILPNQIAHWIVEYNRLKPVLSLVDRLTDVTINRAVVERDKQIANLKQDVIERDKQIDKISSRITAIENSTLWKMTLPLRRALTGKPTLRRFFRRTAQLVRRL